MQTKCRNVNDRAAPGGGGMSRGKFVLTGRAMAMLIKVLSLKYLISSVDVNKMLLPFTRADQGVGFFV